MIKRVGNIGVSPRLRCAAFFPAKRTSRRAKPGATFAAGLRALNFPAHVTEFCFHPTRKWRFDFAWPDYRLALEIEGGVYIGGRHTRGATFEADCEKYAEALSLGWRVLRVTPRHIKDGRAYAWLTKAIMLPVTPLRKPPCI